MVAGPILHLAGILVLAARDDRLFALPATIIVDGAILLAIAMQTLAGS